MDNECKLVETPAALERQIPSFVLRIDKAGHLVTGEELIDNGTVKKITCRIPHNPHEDKWWVEEEVLHLPETTYYISTVDDGYLGDERMYKFLVHEKKLVLIQKSIKTQSVCSIGYSPEENKWYGWSHRAIHGFTIGDEVKKGDLTNDSGLVEEYRIQHPEEDYSLPVGFKALTLNDAKRMAIAFAEAVG